MTILYALIIITCFVQIAFYAFIFSKFLSLKDETVQHDLIRFQPVSVVICAKNEFQNLRSNLPLILSQDFDDFEVIVIDDGSIDNSHLLLKEFEDIYPNFLSFRIDPNDKNHPGKKQALSYGVSLAKHEHIVVTDADCRPVSKLWLQYMTAELHKDGDVILGISPYHAASGGLNAFFRLENYSIALQYINFTLSGVPFMGVGRNMAYKKSVFDSYNIEQHWDLVSGDDDLMVNALSSEYTIKIAPHPNAFTLSDAPKSLSAWFQQKLRHYTTGYHYDLMQKIWLGYYWTSSLLLYLLFGISVILLAFQWPIHPVPLIALVGTLLLRWMITFRSLKKLGEKKLNWSIPCLDFFYIISVWVVSPLSRVSNFKWK